MHISSLYVYPVKSCAGISVTSAEIAERGFARDRRWLVTDEAGHFLTQREEPRMALVGTALDGDDLILSAPGAAPLRLPAEPRDGEWHPVEVWIYRGQAREQPAASAWFSRVLDRPCRALFMPDEERRPIRAEYAQPGEIVSFADGFPFMLISESSRDELARRVGEPLSMRRFRPSLVVSGAAPFAEDRWWRLRAGAAVFRNAKPCERCTITTLDPDTAEGGKEPLRTLATFRKHDGKIHFGVNLIQESGGVLRVGDEVTILEERPSPHGL